MKITFNNHNYISFRAMKKSQFDGLNLNLIEKFKPPIEKFNSRFELDCWFEKQYDKTLKKDYKGRKQEAQIQRKLMIKQWHDYITKENLLYTTAQRLLIISGITQFLKPNEDRIPPVLNGGALADTVEEIDKKVKEKPKIQFNFLKLYNKKLGEIYAAENNGIEVSGLKWMIIPSQKHDPKNFKKTWKN